MFAVYHLVEMQVLSVVGAKRNRQYFLIQK